MVVVLVAALVVANAITSFSPDESSQGPSAPLKNEISRFLNATLLPLGVFTIILLLSVFASIYVEQLALRLTQSKVSVGMAQQAASVSPPDDLRWQK